MGEAVDEGPEAYALDDTPHAQPATLGLLQKMGEAYEQELEDLKASAIE